jgi:hypothetical protein
MRQSSRSLRPMRYFKHLSTSGIVAVVAVLTVIIMAFWLFLAPELADSRSLSNDQWSRLDALTSIAGLAFGLGAGVLVLIELSETSDSRNLDIYRDIYEKLMTDEEIEARRHIYQHLPDFRDFQNQEEQTAEIKRIYAEESQTKDCVKQVLNLLDYFGFLVEQDWVTADEVIGWLSPVVVKVWIKIGPMVDYERAQRPEEPDYYLSAVRLAEKCQAWRDRNYSKRKDITFSSDRL